MINVLDRIDKETWDGLPQDVLRHVVALSQAEDLQAQADGLRQRICKQVFGSNPEEEELARCKEMQFVFYSPEAAEEGFSGPGHYLVWNLANWHTPPLGENVGNACVALAKDVIKFYRG